MMTKADVALTVEEMRELRKLANGDWHLSYNVDTYIMEMLYRRRLVRKWPGLLQFKATPTGLALIA